MTMSEATSPRAGLLTRIRKVLFPVQDSLAGDGDDSLPSSVKSDSRSFEVGDSLAMMGGPTFIARRNTRKVRRGQRQKIADRENIPINVMLNPKTNQPRSAVSRGARKARKTKSAASMATQLEKASASNGAFGSTHIKTNFSLKNEARYRRQMNNIESLGSIGTVDTQEGTIDSIEKAHVEDHGEEMSKRSRGMNPRSRCGGNLDVLVAQTQQTISLKDGTSFHTQANEANADVESLGNLVGADGNGNSISCESSAAKTVNEKRQKAVQKAKKILKHKARKSSVRHKPRKIGRVRFAVDSLVTLDDSCRPEGNSTIETNTESNAHPKPSEPTGVVHSLGQTEVGGLMAPSAGTDKNDARFKSSPFHIKSPIRLGSRFLSKRLRSSPGLVSASPLADTTRPLPSGNSFVSPTAMPKPSKRQSRKKTPLGIHDEVSVNEEQLIATPIGRGCYQDFVEDVVSIGSVSENIFMNFSPEKRIHRMETSGFIRKLFADGIPSPIRRPSLQHASSCDDAETASIEVSKETPDSRQAENIFADQACLDPEEGTNTCQPRKAGILVSDLEVAPKMPRIMEAQRPLCDRWSSSASGDSGSSCSASNMGKAKCILDCSADSSAKAESNQEETLAVGAESTRTESVPLRRSRRSQKPTNRLSVSWKGSDYEKYSKSAGEMEGRSRREKLPVMNTAERKLLTSCESNERQEDSERRGAKWTCQIAKPDNRLEIMAPGAKMSRNRKQTFEPDDRYNKKGAGNCDENEDDIFDSTPFQRLLVAGGNGIARDTRVADEHRSRGQEPSRRRSRRKTEQAEKEKEGMKQNLGGKKVAESNSRQTLAGSRGEIEEDATQNCIVEEGGLRNRDGNDSHNINKQLEKEIGETRPKSPATTKLMHCIANANDKAKVASKSTTQEACTSSNGIWTNDQVELLRRANIEVEPTSSIFWDEVAARIDGKSAIECRDKWFSLVQTPKPRPKRGRREKRGVNMDIRGMDGNPRDVQESREVANRSSLGVGTWEEVDDDIFNSTPLKAFTAQGRSANNDCDHDDANKSSNIGREVQIALPCGFDSPIGHSPVSGESYSSVASPIRFRNGYKGYIGGLIKGRRMAEAQIGKSKKVVQVINERGVAHKELSATAGAGDVQMNCRLLPDGTVEVEAPSETDLQNMYIPSDDEI